MEETEKYHLINHEIKIDKNKLPKIVLEYVQKLEHYNKINDDVMYAITFEAVDPIVKSFAIDGKLTTKDYEMFWEKYGGNLG